MNTDNEPVTFKHYRTVVARLDALDGRLGDLHRRTIGELAGEVAGLKRAVVKLVERQKPAEGQPDWIGNRDLEAAVAMLDEVHAWVGEVAAPLGLDVKPCWPWHGAAVAVLLAGQQHHRAVYAGDRTVDVLDLHTRYLDAIQRRVGAITRDCDNARHAIGEAYFRFDGDGERLPELAAWYAAGAQGLPPALQPFGLARSLA